MISVTVLEGGSVNVSCTSTGNPLPMFRWVLSGMNVNFTQSSTTLELQTSGGSVDSPFSFTVGSTTSTLHIVNVGYFQDIGTYECIATNAHNGVEATSNSSIAVNAGLCTIEFCYFCVMLLSQFVSNILREIILISLKVGCHGPRVPSKSLIFGPRNQCLLTTTC